MKKFFYILPVLAMLFSCSSDDGGEIDTKPFTTCPLEVSQREIGMIGETNSMSWNLLRRSLKEGQNTLLSPFSLSACLAMIDNGAGGETEAQIREFLGFKDFSQGEFNDFFRNLITSLPNVDTSVKLSIANSFWYQNNLTPVQSFTQCMNDFYDAETFPTDFKSSKTLGTINKWCSDKTNKLIPNFLDDLDPSTVSMIINALYFNAKWSDEFNEKNTNTSVFYKSDGTTRKAKFMHRTSDETALLNDVISMVSLPMGKYNQMQAFFVLPNEGKTLADAADAAQAALGDARTHSVSQLRRYNVKMSIPKFKVETKESLKEMLQNMGLTLPFTEHADFSNLFTDASVFLSDVKQACFFSVDEHEVKAAAVTEGDYLITSVGPSSMKMELNLNRPFLYGVYERNTGTILFLGAMEEPKE